MNNFSEFTQSELLKNCLSNVNFVFFKENIIKEILIILKTVKHFKAHVKFLC